MERERQREATRDAGRLAHIPGALRAAADDLLWLLAVFSFLWERILLLWLLFPHANASLIPLTNPPSLPSLCTLCAKLSSISGVERCCWPRTISSILMSWGIAGQVRLQWSETWTLASNKLGVWGFGRGGGAGWGLGAVSQPVCSVVPTPVYQWLTVARIHCKEPVN